MAEIYSCVVQYRAGSTCCLVGQDLPRQVFYVVWELGPDRMCSAVVGVISSPQSKPIEKAAYARAGW